MPNLTPDLPGSAPADPPSLVSGGGGAPTPVDPPSLVPPPAGVVIPEAPPSLPPSLPGSVELSPPPSVVPNPPAPNPETPPSIEPSIPPQVPPGAQWASQEQAEAGASADTLMSPLRTKQAIEEFADPKGTADGLDASNVKLTGNQTKSGVLTFASSPVSTGTPSGGTGIMNRVQTDQRRLPFLRPLDTYQFRNRSDYFFRGSTTTGDIGEWAWSLDGTASVSLGNPGFASGKSIAITTGSTSGNAAAIYKTQGSSGVETKTALTTYLLSDFSSVGTSALVNAAVWTGWVDSYASPTGVLLVGWDRSVSSNFLVRMRGSVDGSETVHDTGVAVPTAHTFTTPQFAITIIGQGYNVALGGSSVVRVVIVGNTGNNAPTVLVDQTYTPRNVIFNPVLQASVITRTAAAKLVVVSGVEMSHPGPFAGAQH